MATMPDLAVLVSLLRVALRDRAQLVLENAALRQQLAVYKRSVKRPNIKNGDRIFWMTMMRLLREWKEAVVIVKPATVVKWHRRASGITGGESRAASPDGLRSA
jgi:high-affinity Fe2+/Pb2+ permease